MESWYLADLSAVEKALNIKKLSKYQNKALFRNPDIIENPSKELEKITNGQYQKVSGSRKIGEHIDLQNTRSGSFHHLIKSIEKASACL